MSTRENIRLIARAPLSSWCLVMVEWLFLAVPRGCLQFVIVVFPDHTHYFWSLGNRPVIVKRAVIGLKGGWRLNTIFKL